MAVELSRSILRKIVRVEDTESIVAAYGRHERKRLVAQRTVSDRERSVQGFEADPDSIVSWIKDSRKLLTDSKAGLAKLTKRGPRQTRKLILFSKLPLPYPAKRLS